MANVDYRDDEHRYIVSAPAVLTSIAQLLGTNIKDVGRLCTSDKINKWAIYKPQSPSDYKGIGLLTLDQRKADNMGLQKAVISGMADGGTGVSSCPLNVSSRVYEWSYKTRTQPYRLHDFLCNPVTGNGYNHKAKPCDADWHDTEQKLTDPLTMTFGNFSFRITEESSTYMGSADMSFLPLSYIESDLSKWYIGIAIYITNSDSTKTGWYFIRSLDSLGTVASAVNKNISRALPTLSTNQWLMDQMAGTTEFTCLPCLLENPQTKKTADDNQYTYISMNQGNVYSMPSGAKTFKLKFNVAIKNSYVTTQRGSGYKLTGNYYLSFNQGAAYAQYLIKGFTNAQGRTTSGWFLFTPIVSSASYGFYTRTYVIAYVTIDENNNMSVGAQPTSGISVDRTFVTKYFSEISQNGAKEAYIDYNIKTTISNSSIKAFDGLSFYGYIANTTTESRPGLALEYATNDSYQ